MKKVLLLAPLYDVPTITSSLAVKDLLMYAGDLPNLDIDFLFGATAHRFLFDTYTSVKKYNAIIYYGHGESGRLLGTHIFWSIINKRNIHKARGIGISTMACESAETLGQEAIANGVRTYIGTITPVYAAFPEKEHNFLRDWREVWTLKDKLILEGATFGEAYDAFDRKYTEVINNYKEKIGIRNYDYYYEASVNNRNNTVLLGDRDYSI